MFNWYLFGAIAAMAVGWLAAVLNLAGYAPVGLLPAGVGMVLGAILAGLAAFTHVTCRKRLIVGAVLLALLAALAEHAWLYHDFRRQWHEARAKSPQVAMFRPETPWSPREYIGREMEEGRAVLWLVDAALVVGATAGTVWGLRRVIPSDSSGVVVAHDAQPDDL